VERAATPLRERLSDSVSALESPYASGRAGDFYTREALLGRSTVLGDETVFRVSVDTGRSATPPRYYWRGWVYDSYELGKWSNVGSQRGVRSRA
jgi:hypothetical protein